MRIAVYIEGAYFTKINMYYRYYNPIKSNMTFNGLFDFFKSEIALGFNMPYADCIVCDSHWYRGRFSTSQIEKKYIDNTSRLKQFSNERKMSDLFMYQGIKQHYYPVQINPKTGQASDSIVSMYLIADVLESAFRDEYDAVVLLLGDVSYLPLIKKLNKLGKRVILPVWDFEYVDQESGMTQTTRSSQTLINEANYNIYMDELLSSSNEESDKLIKMIFRK